MSATPPKTLNRAKGLKGKKHINEEWSPYILTSPGTLPERNIKRITSKPLTKPDTSF